MELQKQGACRQLRGCEVDQFLDGKKIAVDGAIWLYEAQCQQDLLRSFGGVGATVKIFFERCCRWLRKGILPVIVLEGEGGGRGERKHGANRLGNTFVPHAKVFELLSAMGIPFVHAEGEAEATCAKG